jgi:predicted RNA-binding Zn-ribbon protein involved in translation (DUF1610 family)
MSLTIVCHICSARLTVPDGYVRDKLRCPECGVMCPLPPRPVEKKADERQPAEDAARFEDDEPAKPVRSAPPPPVTTFLKEPADKGFATCPHCGEMVRAPARKRARQAKCPNCGAAWPAPVAPPKPAPASVPLPPLPDEFAGSTPDQDPESGNPYRTADVGSRRCPGCSDRLAPEVVVCVRCGFDLRTGRKIAKEYQPLERSWNSGMPLQMRLVLFLLSQAIALIAVGAGFLSVEDSPAIKVWTFGLSWLVYTTMTGFLLGTFDRFEMKRHRSGRVDLVRTWRVGFIPWPPTKIDVRDYFGVIHAARSHSGMLEWLVFIFLLGFGLVPALLYWYCAIHQIEYTVALTSVHGNPEVYVYRGWSEKQMHEIKETLQQAMTV